MIILSRRKNESIVIGDHIQVVVVEIRGDKVRLAIETPRHVSVHRREVWDAIQRIEDHSGEVATEPTKTATALKTATTVEKVVSRGTDELGLVEVCQRFLNRRKTAGRTVARGDEALDDFRRAVMAELELITIEKTER